MRTTHIASLAAVGILLTVSLARAQDRTTTRDDGTAPCEFLIRRIERELHGIDGALDRLSQLARLGTPEDRARVARIHEDFAGKRDRLREKYTQVIDNVDLSCEECVAGACRRMRSKLVEVHDRLGVSLRELLQAETRVRRAVATAKRVGHAIRITDRAVLRAAQLARKTDDGDEAFPGLRRAFELQEEARQALAAGRFEPAMKMTLRARDLVGRTMRDALDSADVAAVRRRVVEYWKQTNRMIERIEDRIDPEKNPRAARLLAMAGQEQARARELAEDHPYRAVRNARHARRIVNELTGFHRRARHCEDRVERLGERIGDAEEIVEESGDEKAARILEKGVSHYTRGVELCEQGNAARATAQFDIASKLVAKAVDIAKGNTPKSHAVDREIRKTGLVVRHAGRVAETDEQKARVERAEKLVEEARERKDNARVSLELLDKATDIAFGVIARAGGDNDREDDR